MTLRKSPRRVIHYGRNEYSQKSCLKALCTSDYQMLKNRNIGRTADTGYWVTRHQRFLDWKGSATSGLLWISADPGCGKSVLGKALVDEELKTTPKRTTCHFFFKEDDEDGRDITNAMRCLLHQLFKARPQLLPHGATRIRHYGDRIVEDFSYLFDLFVSFAEHPEAGEIVCVLDGLDECGESDRSAFLTKVKAFFQHNATQNCHSSLIKFVILSRLCKNVEQMLEDSRSELPITHIPGEDPEFSGALRDEVDIEIRRCAKTVARELLLTDNLQMEVEKALLQPLQRTHLWVFLIFEILRGLADEKAISNFLSDLPTTLSAIYERILYRAHTSFTLLWSTEHLLHIMLAATRPLAIEELSIAITIAPEMSSQKDLDLPDEKTFREEIEYRCGSFIRIVESKAYFVHQTARDFLLSSSNHSQIGLSRWQNVFDIRTSEAMLANSCIWYLSLDDQPRGQPAKTMWQSNLRGADSKVYSSIMFARAPSFLYYAILKWTTHLTQASVTILNISEDALISLCNCDSIQWSQRYPDSYSVPPPWSELVIASYLGLTLAIKAILRSKLVKESKDDINIALMYAAEYGHESIVRMLLDTKADSNCVFQPASTRRVFGSFIARKTGLMIVTYLPLLIFFGKEKVDRIFKKFPISVAVHNCLLRVKGHRVETLEEFYYPHTHKSALQVAAQEGHTNIISLLLEAGADINTGAGTFEPALAAAAANGQYESVALLLKEEAIVNLRETNFGIRSKSGATALELACSKGHEDISQLLIANGADRRSVATGAQKLLQKASRDGDERLVILALSNGADLNASDNWSTPLMSAVFYEHPAVVKLLLDNGANPNVKSPNSWITPLNAAVSKNKKIESQEMDVASEEHKTMAELLIESGADVNIGSGPGTARIALIAASRLGNKDLVELLLETGADINAKNDKGQTALEVAVEREIYPEVVNLLLNWKTANV